MDGKNELIVQDSNALLDIFLTEDDKKGTDILKMSNFFDIAVNKIDSRLENEGKWEIVLNIDGLFGSIASAIKGGFDVSNLNMLVADTSHFSKEIVEGLKKGIYHVGQSKEVAGNLRPAILDEKERLVKFVTLKRAINPSEVLTDISNISMQLTLGNISNQIEEVERDVQGLVEFSRREKLSNRFVYAREKIMRVVNDETHRETLLEEADTYLMEGIVDLYSDLDAEISNLMDLHGPFRSLKAADNALKHINEDMLMIPRYLGLRVYLLNLRGLKNEADRVLGDFRYHLENIAERKLPGQEFTAFELVHQYYPYDKDDVDFWITKPNEILSGLKQYEGMLEHRVDEIIYIQGDIEDD